jgi:hypothetical protein
VLAVDRSAVHRDGTVVDAEQQRAVHLQTDGVGR